MMSFQDAIRVCLQQKYADFSGRARRPEFWWFVLFCFLVSVALSIVHQWLAWAFQLAVLVPSIAVGTRRLHDIGRSGWWQLIGAVPLLCAMPLLGMAPSTGLMLAIGLLSLISLIAIVVLLAQASAPDDAPSP